ncbi:MAG: outer membrane lipoprotein carrier protein LolA [Saprospirales bacterium]|nr:outer membrane lipoprotein carrier protein LolA [Saprospirales bacterium]MBK8491660.1 outer membrane lipoprotein carrier protein LolA [Saprospirales bacterium]
MLKSMLFTTCLGLFAAAALAQPTTNQYSKAGDSDPAAKAILEKVKVKYEAYKSVEAAFTLSIELPNQPVEEQPGKLIQQGVQYRLELPSQHLLCDGKSIWLYLKNNKEVQINNFEEDEDSGFLSPMDLLRIYEREDFVYVLSNEYAEGGKIVQDIEFKPLDAASEYSKMRLSVEKGTSQIMRIKAFAKDGSRYTLSVSTFKSNATYPASTFVWNKADCPDCYLEDLRID